MKSTQALVQAKFDCLHEKLRNVLFTFSAAPFSPCKLINSNTDVRSASYLNFAVCFIAKCKTDTKCNKSAVIRNTNAKCYKYDNAKCNKAF